MKAIPKSLNPEPYTKSTKPVGLRPPSFRTAVHRPLDNSDPKRPPSFETGHRETPLDRAGIAVEASDRTYVTTPEGSIRRADGGGRRPEKSETRQKAKARERIEAGLQKRDRRRQERTLRHSLDDSLIRAEKTRKHAEWLLEQIRAGRMVQGVREGKTAAVILYRPGGEADEP